MKIIKCRKFVKKWKLKLFFPVISFEKESELFAFFYRLLFFFFKEIFPPLLHWNFAILQQATNLRYLRLSGKVEM